MASLTRCKREEKTTHIFLLSGGIRHEKFMQRACSWRERKTRVSRAPYQGMHLLSHCRAPAWECSWPPAVRPATAQLPQPPQPLQPPLAPGAEQEPRASASARPASAGRAGSASSLGDGVAPRGSGSAAARRGTAAGPARAPVDPFWVSTPGRELGGFARKATRRPSCWQGVGAQGDPNSPKFGLCWIKENWVALEGIRHLVECSLSSQSTSHDHCPSPGGSELWSNKRTWAGCEILQRCLWRELAAGLALSARVAHADTENADQRSLTFSEKGFRNRGCTLLN